MYLPICFVLCRFWLVGGFSGLVDWFYCAFDVVYVLDFALVGLVC